MSQGQSTYSQGASMPRTYGPSDFLRLAVFLLVVAGAVYGFWWLYSPSTIQGDDPPNTTNAPNLLTDNQGQPLSDDLARLEKYRDEINAKLDELKIRTASNRVEHDLQVARMEALGYRHDEVKKLVVEIRDLRSKWQFFIDSLMQNDRGRQVAADESQVVVLAGILERELVSIDEIDAWQKQMDRQFRTIKDKDLDPDQQLVIPEGFASETERIQAEVRSALSLLQQTKSAVDGIVAASASPKVDPKSPTLEDVIKAHRDSQAKAREEFLAAEVQKVKDEFRQEIADEAKKTEVELSEAKIARERRIRKLALVEAQAASDKEAMEVADAIAAIRVAAEEEEKSRKKAALVKSFEAEYPAIKGMLTPITAEGFGVPTGGSYVSPGKVKGPMSFGKLKSAGVLETNPEAMRSFLAMGNSHTNDRPQGGFPNNSNARSAFEETERIQKFILRYGDIMVEKNILAP